VRWRHKIWSLILFLSPHFFFHFIVLLFKDYSITYILYSLIECKGYLKYYIVSKWYNLINWWKQNRLGLCLNVELYYDFTIIFIIVYFMFWSFNSGTLLNSSAINKIYFLFIFICILAYFFYIFVISLYNLNCHY